MTFREWLVTQEKRRGLIGLIAYDTDLALNYSNPRREEPQNTFMDWVAFINTGRAGAEPKVEKALERAWQEYEQSVPAITEEAFSAMLKAHPVLNDGGATYPSPVRSDIPEERVDPFPKWRQALEGDFPRVAEIAQWITANTYQVKRFTEHTSYGWKHVAEKEIGYVSNGEFIAAALLCRYRIKPNKGSPELNMRLTKEAKRRIAERYPTLGHSGLRGY